MDRKLSLAMIVFILGFASLACSFPLSAPTPTMTDSVEVTDTVQTTITETPTATPAPPTETPLPTATVEKIPCSLAEFVMDLNYLDGTAVESGTTFTKTWRLKNIGSCSWASDYSIVFFAGDNLSAPASVALTGSVPPGSTTDLSVNLKAPPVKGTYQAYFKLRAPDGTLFGVGEDSSTAFWVQIKAVKAADIPVLTRTLKLMNPSMNGTDVKQLQARLAELGYKPGTVDGIFGTKTDLAVRAFQSDHGLTSDGIVGQLTWTALFQ